MNKHIVLNTEHLQAIRKQNPCLVSYNIEMTEVTGGTFWKPYTEAQIDGKEAFIPVNSLTDIGKLQSYFPPIDLQSPLLRSLAKELGPAWIRVSGTWANKTYYDFDGSCHGVVPEGYQNLLTREQWTGVLDFVKFTGSKLLVSVANCPGNHAANEPWNPEQAELLFSFSRDYGVPIAAAEFTNEPNMMEFSGLPDGYTPDDYARDHDIFARWLRKNYPDCLFVGPCTIFDADIDLNGMNPEKLAEQMSLHTTEDLLYETLEQLDVFSYHCYNGVSERGASIGAHWGASQALSDAYLDVAGNLAEQYLIRRDWFSNGTQLWVTESGDAACGGNTWASTYLDVPRTLNELGAFSVITEGVIFHNTLASSDYGFLEHGSFLPRPNYFAVLLWKKLMGETVYDAKFQNGSGIRIYCHSRKDGKEGYVYLVLNTSVTEHVTVQLPKAAECYLLDGGDDLRSRTMYLNGKPLLMNGNALPAMTGKTVSAGRVTVPPAACLFIVL